MTSSFTLFFLTVSRDEDEHDDDGYDEDRNKVEPEIEKKKFEFHNDVK